jgi:hypothetical protein
LAFTSRIAIDAIIDPGTKVALSHREIRHFTHA